jgi:hypothetical protein
MEASKKLWRVDSPDSGGGGRCGTILNPYSAGVGRINGETLRNSPSLVFAPRRCKRRDTAGCSVTNTYSTGWAV